MVTLIRRKCVINLLNLLNKPKQFGGFSQRKCTFQARWLHNNMVVASSSLVNSSQYNRWRCLHTSNSLRNIVAFKLSDIGEGIREVVIKEWFVKVGDKVEQFDNICEVQSDKAAVTITSRYDGVITKLYGAVDDTLLVGNTLVDIEVQGDGDSEDAERTTTSGVDTSSSSSEDEPEAKNAGAPRARILTTPAVRRIAAQYSLDLQTVRATGRNGRVLKEDVLQHLNLTSDQSNIVPDPGTVQAQSLSVQTGSPQANFLPASEDKIVPVSGFTKAMVKSMTESLKIPHFVLSDEYEVTELVRLRTELKGVAAARGVRLSYMPFIVKAASLALLQYPILNSSLDTNCENIIYKGAHHIGVAMDTPNGLVVPVIKNVQQKSILEIGSELNRLQDLGAKGRLGLAEVSGGTFTVSNIGTVGGTYTKPVILAPQVSIGAFGKIQKLPRFDECGAVRAAHVVNASWSADHRVVDGVTMARFSNALKLYLEQPNYFIIDL